MPADETAFETELKFTCPPDRLEAVLAAAPAGRDETRELISVYFDTADHDLRKAGVSLRVRESEGRRIQTCKRGSGVVREEHETEIEGFAPDPTLGPLPELLSDADAHALKPCFHVRVTRRQRTVRHRGAVIELAVDQGEIQAGAVTRPISEVELELKSGPPAALFALARKLSRGRRLSLSFEGKAAQGQALLAGGASARPAWPALDPAISAEGAFRALAAALLAQITAGAAVVREAPDVRAIHRLRVSVRRLRSTLSTFRPLFADDAAEALGGRLRGLARSLDRARNLDVFAETFLAPAEGREPPIRGFPALARAVDEARGRAAATAARAVRGPAFEALMLDAVEWTLTGALDPDASVGPARDFAANALKDRFRRLRKRARGLSKLSDEERHAVRIEAKKLRYATEALQSLFPGGGEGFIRRLKALQDALGALNDVATAQPLIGSLRLAPEAAFAAGEVVGLQAAETAEGLSDAGEAMARLKRAERFWKT